MQQNTPSQQVLDDSPAQARSGALRWLSAAIGCVGSWSIGLVAGALIARSYERAMYPPEPDPVQSDVGSVLLLVWALIGVVGSVFFIRRVVRGGVGRSARRCAFVVCAFVICALGACSAPSEDVRFRSRDVVLAGTLILPDGPAPHPAIVLVHGDGPESREGYRYLARQFAASGVAALIYDKRGVGESTGRWPARFDDLAADAVAAIAYLRTRPDIDGDRVGIWGGSQGGWIVPLAAASPDARVRCAIIKAAPGVGPADLARWKSTIRVARAGYPADVIARVQNLMDLQFAILRTGVGWQELDAQVRASRSEPWFPLVAVMRHSGWRSSWMTYGRDIDFDPMPALMRVDAPILWLLGERDPETPLPETLAAIRRLQASGKDITVRVFAGADHQIELPRTWKDRPNYAPGYLETTLEWVVDRCAAKPNS